MSAVKEQTPTSACAGSPIEPASGDAHVDNISINSIIKKPAFLTAKGQESKLGEVTDIDHADNLFTVGRFYVLSSDKSPKH